MKKFGIVLLSLGLIAAFSVSAFAVTPEMTGQYYARGSYWNNPSMLEQTGGTGRGSLTLSDQRLRTFIRLKIADGLTFTSRMDSMEVIWGQNLKNSINNDNGKNNQQSVAWEQTYLTFDTAIGKFDVGYKSGTPYGWGTKFMNAPGTAPGVKWQKTFGDLSLVADYNKTSTGDLDNSTANPQLKQQDASNIYYDLGGRYKFKGGDAGFLWTYFRNALTRTPTNGTLTTNNVLQPYGRAKFGPVEVEAEAYIMRGQTALDTPTAGSSNTDISTKGLYVNGKVNLGPAYAGAKFVYASGDDKTTSKEIEGTANGTFKYGTDTAIWGQITPAIMFGYGYHGLSVASIPTKGDPTGVDPGTTMDNVWLYSIYGGANIGKKLTLNARAFYMKADQEGKAPTSSATWQSKEYGKELDLQATYKIYDNLEYNVGVAYLWTGDWFKGTNPSADVKNVYYITHWLDLNF
jgi:hypothetical protein